jgi:hypothetical protein
MDTLSVGLIVMLILCGRSTREGDQHLDVLGEHGVEGADLGSYHLSLVKYQPYKDDLHIIVLAIIGKVVFSVLSLLMYTWS